MASVDTVAEMRARAGDLAISTTSDVNGDNAPLSAGDSLSTAERRHWAARALHMGRLMMTIAIENLDAVSGGGMRSIIGGAAAGALTAGSTGAVLGFGLGLTGGLGFGAIPGAVIGAAGGAAIGAVSGAGAAVVHSLTEKVQ